MCWMCDALANVKCSRFFTRIFFKSTHCIQHAQTYNSRGIFGSCCTLTHCIVQIPWLWFQCRAFVSIPQLWLQNRACMLIPRLWSQSRVLAQIPQLWSVSCVFVQIPRHWLQSRVFVWKVRLWSERRSFVRILQHLCKFRDFRSKFWLCRCMKIWKYIY